MLARWKRYDVALGDIARAVSGKYPAATAIDIGVNVGDGAEGEALAAVESLASIGYRHHLVYDNFGNFLVSIDAVGRFAELNAYLQSNRRHGRAVYYFDVCSFHDSDTDLFEQIRGQEIRLAAD